MVRHEKPPWGLVFSFAVIGTTVATIFTASVVSVILLIYGGTEAIGDFWEKGGRFQPIFLITWPLVIATPTGFWAGAYVWKWLALKTGMHSREDIYRFAEEDLTKPK